MLAWAERTTLLEFYAFYFISGNISYAKEGKSDDGKEWGGNWAACMSVQPC